MEAESQFTEDVGGGNDNERKVASRRRRKQASYVIKLEVLWKSFEEANLMDAFESGFEGGIDDGGDNNPNVSSVSELDLENVSNVESEKANRNKKVILGQ